MGGHVVILLALFFCCSVGQAEEVIKIPLSEIWAFDMPGTKDIGELSIQDPNPKEVRRLLRKPKPKIESVRPAFAVQGTGREAFRNRNEVLVEGKEPQHIFDTNKEISIVFFSHEDNWYVHLQSVLRKGKIITVNYKFISHETQETTHHFAIIPLGKLPSGTYQVDPVPIQVNSNDEPAIHPVADEIINRIVSGPFSFTIKE